MAIENEIKYVIRGYDFLESLVTARYGWHDITQGYLTNNNRIREITHQNGLVTHVFSFKQRLPNGHNIEIESDEMTKDNFDHLWEFTTERCQKRRTSKFIQLAELIRWDIDFPRWESGNKYFAMAEIEMPPSWDAPPYVLPEIADYVAYVVPRNDNRFSARKLCSEKHAKRMAQELGLWPQ